MIIRSRDSRTLISTIVAILAICLIGGFLSGQQTGPQGQTYVESDITKLQGSAPEATNSFPFQYSDGTAFRQLLLDTNFAARLDALLTALTNATYTAQVTNTFSASITTNGLAQESHQLTLIGHVDGLEALGAETTNWLQQIYGVFTVDGGALLVSNIAPVTVSGVVTETNFNTRIPLLQAGLDTLAGAVGGSEIQVDLVDLNGAATAANQQTNALTDAELRANPVPTDPSNATNIGVTAQSWPLPTGASTEATLASRASESNLSGQFNSLRTQVGTPNAMTNFNAWAAQFATSANQDTANGHLATIAGDTTSLDGKDFALESGGNLAAIAGSAAVMEAWDDGSDRAKVSVQVFSGAASWAHGQVYLTNGPTLIAPARSGRRSIMIINAQNGVCYIGTNNLTTLTGLFLMGTNGAGMSLDHTNAVYGRVSSGSNLVSFAETYD